MLNDVVFGELFEELTARGHSAADQTELAHSLFPARPVSAAHGCCGGARAHGADRYFRPLVEKYPRFHIDTAAYLQDGGIEEFCNKYGAHASLLAPVIRRTALADPFSKRWGRHRRLAERIDLPREHRADSRGGGPMMKDSAILRFPPTASCPSCPIIDMHGHYGPFSWVYMPRSDADAMIASILHQGVKALAFSSHTALFHDVDAGNDLTRDVVRQHRGRLFGYIVINPHFRSRSTVLTFRQEPGFLGFNSCWIIISTRSPATIRSGSGICRPAWPLPADAHVGFQSLRRSGVGGANCPEVSQRHVLHGPFG